MTKQIINVNQKKRYQEVDINGRLLTFEKDNGYFFSDSQEHKEIVEVLLSRKGFNIKEANKTPKVDLEPKENKKVSEKENKEDKTPMEELKVTPIPKKKETSTKKGE